MEAFFTAIVLVGGYFLLKTIFIYEMKVAKAPVKAKNNTSRVKRETANENFLYYTSYKYLA